MSDFKLYKVGCVFPMIVVSILPRAKLGRNDHREDALHFVERNCFSETYIILSGFEFKVLFFISNFDLILKTLSTRLFFSIKTGWTSFDRTPMPAKIKFCLSDRQSWHLGYVDDFARWYKFQRLPHHNICYAARHVQLVEQAIMWNERKSTDSEEPLRTVPMCESLVILYASKYLTKC